MSSTGQRYRVRFAIAMWMALIFLFVMMPSSTYFVHNPNSRFIAMAAMLLTVAFTIFTIILGILERRRASHASAGK